MRNVDVPEFHDLCACPKNAPGPDWAGERQERTCSPAEGGGLNRRQPVAARRGGTTGQRRSPAQTEPNAHRGASRDGRVRCETHRHTRHCDRRGVSWRDAATRRRWIVSGAKRGRAGPGTPCSTYRLDDRTCTLDDRASHALACSDESPKPSEKDRSSAGRPASWTIIPTGSCG